MQRVLVIGSLSLAFLGLAVACDREPPPPDLRFQMFHVDYATKEIEKSMRNPELLGTVADSAAKIATLAADASFERYEAKPKYPLPADKLGQFREWRRLLGERAAAVEQAARAGNGMDVQLKFAQLRILCDTCHATFRPGL